MRGARGLFAVRAAALGWYILSTFIWLLPIGDRFELWFRVSAGLWLAFGAAELVAVVPFSQGRQGTTAESPARALLMLLAVGFLLSVVQDLPELGGPRLLNVGSGGGRALGLAHQALFVAAEICLWIAL